MPATNPTCFDFGDPEFWTIRGVPEQYSQTVAESSPLYWIDAYDFPENDAVSASRSSRFPAWGHLCDALETADDTTNLFSQRLIDAVGEKPYDDDEQTWQRALSFARDFLEQKNTLHDAPDPELKKRRALQDGAFLQRGPRLADQHILQKLFPDHGPKWGALRFGGHPEALGHHYCVVGAPRSGKTVLIRLLLQTTPDARLIVYDDKTNLVSAISHLGRKLHILNPFDARSAAWDIAKDADSSNRTAQIARLLVPDAPTQNPYFANAAKQLLAGVMDALNSTAPGQWSFLDLLLSAQSTNVRDVLSKHEPGRSLLQTHLPSADDATARNVLAILDTELSPYKPIAAAWSHTQTKISLTDWVRNSAADLVLGNHDAHRAAMGAINRVFFQLLAESLLDVPNRPETKTPTFVILDELEQLGTLESLLPLIHKGGAALVTLVLGFHDIQELRHHYGQATDGILAMCGHFAFLRVDNSETARFASDLMGEQHVLVEQRATSPANQHQTQSMSHRHVQRPLVPPTELQQLPLTDRHAGLTGYFMSVCHPTYRCHISGDDLFGDDGLIAQPDPNSEHHLSDFEPRPNAQLSFPEDTSAPLERFGNTAPEEDS